MSGDVLLRIASQDTLEAVRDRIGETGDAGGSETTGTVTSKLNSILALTSKMGIDENGMYIEMR